MGFGIPGFHPRAVAGWVGDHARSVATGVEHLGHAAAPHVEAAAWHALDAVGSHVPAALRAAVHHAPTAVAHAAHQVARHVGEDGRHVAHHVSQEYRHVAHHVAEGYHHAAHDVAEGYRHAAHHVATNYHRSKAEYDQGQARLHGVAHALQAGEHAGLDDIAHARKALTDAGARHGPILHALAKTASFDIGVETGFAEGAKDAVVGIGRMAEGAQKLSSAQEWLFHPGDNARRLQTALRTANTLATLVTPAGLATHPEQALALAKGLAEPYRQGDVAQGIGRGVFDVGSLFVGAGEVNGASKVGRAAEVVEAAASAEKAGEAAPILSGAKEAAPAGQGAGSTAGTAGPAADAATRSSQDTSHSTEGVDKFNANVDTSAQTAARTTAEEAAKLKEAQEAALNAKASEEVGKVTAPIDFDGHIFKVEINSKGKVVGGHSTATGDVDIIPNTKTPPNAEGVYRAKVQVQSPTDPKKFIPKSGNGGYSTMFPDSWTVDRVKVEVDAAYKNRTDVGEMWTGVTPSGVKVKGYRTPNTTVYPVY